jgi:hypothetical protein
MAYEGVWRAAVERQWHMDGHRLFMWRQISATENLTVVSPAGGLEMTTYPRGAVPPDGAGIFLPEDTWEALVHFARPFGESAGEIRVLREAIDVERARIDDALGRLIPDRSGR